MKECVALEQLLCGANSLRELDVSGLSSLKKIDCQDNVDLKSLKATNCTALTEIVCRNCALTEIDVSGCTSLNEMNCYQNKLTLLDVSRTGLKTLICSNNLLETLSLNEGLQQLQCSNNNLSTLDLKKLQALNHIECDGNQLTELDTTANTALYVLSCNSNQLTSLNLKNNTELETLRCRFNHIAALDLSANSWLGYHGRQYVRLGKQTIQDFNVTEGTDSSYPFEFDFGNCIPSEHISKIIASSVKGFDENNADVETVYENGIAKFAFLPAGVKYSVTTGHSGEYISNLSMDVRVGEVYVFSVSLNNHVYRAFPQSDVKNWQEAKAYCESLGGHLITITSEEENDVVAELIDRIWISDEEKTYYWLGGKYEDDRWQWVTGEDFSYEPTVILRLSDNWNFLRTSGNYQLWQADDENTKLCFICEWEPVEGNFIPLLPEDTTPQGDDFTGYLQDRRDLSNLMSDPPRVSAPVLPAKFDPREEGRKLPEVRDQGSYGTCWSFASIGALEASYMTRFGGTADLSELHQAWYVYKDPREGHSEELNDKSKPVLRQGGNASLSIHFLSGIGPASEESLKYDQATISDIERLTAGRYPENYPHPVRLSDAYELGEVTSQNRNAMMTIIKKLVYENGAIEVGYNTNRNNPGYNMTSTNYYLPSNVERTGGHAVQIVGWDDNYPRNDFKNTLEINGAWLIKNSYGSDWGEKGYFWLSYEQDLHNVSAYIAAKDTGARMYGHDNLSAKHADTYAWGASVFRAAGNEYLNAVSFYTRDNNVPYKVYVKTHGKEQPTTEDFGIPEEPDAQGTQDYAGYHTVNLASPVSLKAGDYFSVILNFGGIDPLMVIEDDNDSGEDKTSVITIAGRSFFSKSTGEPEAKEWVDGKSILGGSFNGSIRAFTGSGPGGSSIGAVSITTSSLPDGVVGQEYTATLEASSTSKVQWSVSGLPNGLSCEENKISGIPTTEGIYSISVTAGNDEGTDFRTLNLTINKEEEPDNPDNPVNPNNPDNPRTSGSSGGGGGCNALAGLAAIATIAFFMNPARILATLVVRGIAPSFLDKKLKRM